MKLHELLPLLAMAATGCAGETTLKPPPPPVNWHTLEPQAVAQDAATLTPTDLERRVVPAYMSALQSPDLTGLPTVIDEHAHFSFAGINDVNGRKSVVRAHRAMLSVFDNRNFVTRRVFVSADAQAVEWTLQAVHHDTQKTIVIEGLVLLWTRDNGTIKDIHFYYDQGQVNAQVGVEPHPPGTPHVVAMPASDKVEPFEAASSKDEEDNLATVRAWLDALEDNQEAVYLAKLADTVEVTTNSAVLSKKGPQRAYFAAMNAALADVDTQLDSIWAVGPYVVVEYHLVGEQHGALGWIPAQKDTLVKLFSVDICELHDGKITRIRRYDNPMQVLVAAQQIHT